MRSCIFRSVLTRVTVAHLGPEQLITATPRALVAEVAKVAGSKVAETKVAEMAKNFCWYYHFRHAQSSAVQLDANRSAYRWVQSRDMLPADVLADLNRTVAREQSNLFNYRQSDGPKHHHRPIE